MEQRVNIEGMKFYAFHGCLEEEAKIGGNYIVDASFTGDFSEAAQTDDLTKTVDYCKVYDICKKEMAVRSKLIEHVAKRMHDALKIEFGQVTSIYLKLTKMAPPVNGDVASASFEIKS